MGSFAKTLFMGGNLLFRNCKKGMIPLTVKNAACISIKQKGMCRQAHTLFQYYISFRVGSSSVGLGMGCSF